MGDMMWFLGNRSICRVDGGNNVSVETDDVVNGAKHKCSWLRLPVVASKCRLQSHWLSQAK